MSWQADAEAAASVQVAGTDRSALFYNSATHTWYTKDQAGTVAALISGVASITVASSNGFAGTAPGSGAVTLTLSTTINAPVLAGNGTAITAATTTGTGSTVVLQTNPVLITPDLGTPSALVGTNITGTAASLTAGVATTETVTNTSTNANFFPTFVSSSSTGNKALDVAAGLTFNPSTNNLSTTTFTGALAGNASTVTTNANLTGPVTSVGNATSVTNNAITNAMLAQMPTNTIKGNNTGGTANSSDLTTTQVTAMLNPATTSLQGLQSAADKSRSDNWFNKAVYNVLDNGISPSNSGAANVTAWNALMTVLANSTASVYFPPGVYDIASVCNIPAGVHIRVMGAGTTTRTSEAFGTIIRTTSGTADMFTCGDWYNQFTDLTFRTSVTRTAGAVISSGNNVGIEVINCNFNAQFNGIVFSGGANAGNLGYITNCHFTDSVNFSIQIDGANCNSIITACTADCAPASVAHLEVNQCGSLLIDDCDWIRATNNMRLNPDSGTKGVFSVYSTNVFFDTAAGSSVKFMGGAVGTNIQRVKFASCWMSGSVTGCEFAAVTSTNKPTAIDFINCDIYSNSANGILATEVQDFSLSNCRIGANTTAGISTAAASGAVTKFDIQNCRIGPTAGVGANGTGILIAAGTYGGYIVTGCDVSGNTTANITDNGSVTGQGQKQIEDNIGHLLQGQIAAIVAATAGINTTETIVVGGLNIAPIPANSLAIGDSFDVMLFGTCTTTAANITTFRIRMGTAGTTADTAIFTAATPAAAVTGTAIAFQIRLTFTVRTLGAAATLSGHMDIRNISGAAVATASTGIMVIPTQLVAATAAAWSTTTANYISVTCQTAAATTTNTFSEATIVIK